MGSKKQKTISRCCPYKDWLVYIQNMLTVCTISHIHSYTPSPTRGAPDTLQCPPAVTHTEPYTKKFLSRKTFILTSSSNSCKGWGHFLCCGYKIHISKVQ
jgi:hypothetical protein